MKASKPYKNWKGIMAALEETKHQLDPIAKLL